jgi:hypothetical protein
MSLKGTPTGSCPNFAGFQYFKSFYMGSRYEKAFLQMLKQFAFFRGHTLNRSLMYHFTLGVSWYFYEAIAKSKILALEMGKNTNRRILLFRSPCLHWLSMSVL